MAKAKRIMFLCGSPRERGNTNTLVKWAAEAAQAAGAEVEVVDVAQLQVEGQRLRGLLRLPEKPRIQVRL